MTVFMQWASTTFHPSFARPGASFSNNAATGLQPGPLRRLLTFDRGSTGRMLVGILGK